MKYSILHLALAEAALAFPGMEARMFTLTHDMFSTNKSLQRMPISAKLSRPLLHSQNTLVFLTRPSSTSLMLPNNL